MVIGKGVGHGKGVPRDVFRHNRHGIGAHEVPFSLLTPHKLFRRGLLAEHGLRFPEGPRRLEDHALVVPAFFAAQRVSIVADYPCYHWARRSDGGNASRQRPDLAAYFGAVREVLDAVDAHTEPGPLRERLYLRWYRGKVLARFAQAGFARDDPERRRAIVAAARELTRERFAPELDGRLNYSARLRASLLRRGSLEGLEAVSRTLGPLRASAQVRDVQGDGTWLTLRLTGRLQTRDGAHPLRVDAERRLAAPAALRELLTDDERDLTGALADAATVVFLRSAADGAEWDLPTDRSIKLLEAEDGTLRPQVRMRARLSPTVGAAGAPLAPGDYEVHAAVGVAGFFAVARVLRDGEPFVVTVTPALRVEGSRPPVAPTRTAARRAPAPPAPAGRPGPATPWPARPAASPGSCPPSAGLSAGCPCGPRNSARAAATRTCRAARCPPGCAAAAARCAC